MAKIYAEKPLRDYTKVIQYCDEVKADGFDLVDDFSDLFGMNAAGTDAKMRNTKESILEAQFTSGAGNWCTWMFGRDLVNWNNNFTWAKWVTPSRDLISALKERRLELAFEGQRWFDLVRLDKVEEVMNAVYAKDSGRKAQIYTFDKNSYRLPIPQSVIDANDKIHQNPGY